MGLQKNEFVDRLGTVDYERPGVDNAVIEDDDLEDLDGKELAYEAGETSDNPNSIHWSCGPLAIAELDDSRHVFNFSSFKAITELIRPMNIGIMARALKAQLIEKNWLMGSAEVNGFILHEIHRAAMFEKEMDVKLQEKNKKKKPGRVNPKDKNVKQFDVDYKNLIASSIIAKKRQMRKAMLVEYTKENRKIVKKECSDREKDLEIMVLKSHLIDWYLMNIREIAVEECERAEYTSLMMEFKIYAQSLAAGKVVFRNSKITKNKDFVAGVNSISKPNSKHIDLDGSIDIQEVTVRKIDGVEKISTLWYLPHATEALMTLGVCDKINRAVPEIHTKLFQNGNLYAKSITLQKLVIEIMRCVAVFASLYCDNGRFVKSVRDLREAEYITNVMTGIKKDMSHMGAQADCEAAENYLLSKWELWFMKTRLALLSVGYATGMRILQKSSALLQVQEEVMSQKKSTDKRNNPTTTWDFSKLKKRTIYPKFISLASKYSYSKLEPAAKECAEVKIGELENTMDLYTQATMLNFGDSNEEVIRSQMDYLLTRVRIFLLRKEYINLTLFSSPITKPEHVKEVMRLYKMRILVGAVRLYHKQGARGNAATSILLSDEIVQSTNEMELNRMSMSAFEKCQITTLLGELGRQYTTNLLRSAKQYYNQLTDERTGKLFRSYETIEVQPGSGERQFAFKVTDRNYNAKTLILQGFVEDLYKSNSIFLRESRKSTAIPATQILAGNAKTSSSLTQDVKVFCCTKDQLAKAIMKMAIQLSKWGEIHTVEQEHLLPGVIAKLTESLKTSDKMIANLHQERKEFQETFAHQVRLATATAVADISAELASKSVEINELRKSRRVEEKKLRAKIMEEYDDLVSELVMENHVIRNRFNEFRTNTVQEMVQIISETKREELVQLTESAEIPDSLKASALKTIEHDDEINELKDEIHEANMTLLKVRTMYTIKEQSLRSSFTKQINALTEESKKAEEKLWESYRNAEAREQTLRKTINKNNKALLLTESKSDHFQKQLKDEQTKSKQLLAKTDRSVSARTKYDPSNESRIGDAMEKLKYYEKINVDRLLVDLKEKTELIEEMLQKSRNQAKLALQTHATTILSNKYDATRPATAVPAFNKKQRTPIDDVLFRLAATTEENNELKRKLAILTVSTAGKKALQAIPPPEPTGKERTQTPSMTSKSVQTEAQESTDNAEFNEYAETPFSPYFEMDFGFDMSEDSLLERTSMAVTSAKSRGKKASIGKRTSNSAFMRPSVLKNATVAESGHGEAFRPSHTRHSPNAFSPNRASQLGSERMSISAQPALVESPNEIGFGLESPRTLRRVSKTHSALKRPSLPVRVSSARFGDLNVGGQGIGQRPASPENNSVVLPNVASSSDSQKSMWDTIGGMG
ncbi:hypothetical protein HDU98_012246 [Podochytrium sp. JEL0797]|nr:hypothetical protein HDU98_012246 [Podochytrium sp. JEL0797]